MLSFERVTSQLDQNRDIQLRLGFVWLSVGWKRKFKKLLPKFDYILTNYYSVENIDRLIF